MAKATSLVVLKLFFVAILTPAIDGLGTLQIDGTTLSPEFNEGTDVTNTAWPLNAPTFSGDVNYTLASKGSDTTWTKFRISQINASYSELKLNHDFDYEIESDQTGVFKITAKNALGVTVSSIVSIRVNDVNDHTPTFKNLPKTINISEAIGVDTKLFEISGEDGDGTSEFNSITFSIIGGNTGNRFSLEFATQTSVSVQLSSRLDYDTGPEAYNLTIEATDARAGVNPTGLSNTSYLVITVTDVDDLSAAFTKNVYGPINIAEDLTPGSFVVQVTAVDKDKTVKDKVVYGLVEETNPGGLFAINETTGNITLVGSLERKTQPFYALLVSANSTYHDPVHAQVLIVLEDANVHKPNFTSNNYTGQVAENAQVGTLVMVVQATDLDEGSNAEVSYTLEGQQDYTFIVTTVNSLGYIFLNSSLDYDVKDYYNFTVVATESLTSEKYNDTASVVIKVTEILSNENNPKFNQTSYAANVTEEQLAGKVIQVSAVDADQEKYGSITYSIVDGAFGMFTIDNKTGWINTTSGLDREDRDSYILTVRASDGGTYPRHTDVLVIVTVLDSNDHSPAFLAPSYSGSVVENSNVGNTILAVVAKDLDEGVNALFNFTIVGGDEMFSVVSDGNLGYVIVNGSLDFETKSSYTFLVVAQETATSEKEKTNVSVTISLIDVNDNNPVFSPVSGYYVSLEENSPNGTFLLNVTATDQDSGTFGQIVYSLVTSSAPFTIDAASGEITTDGNLDKETTPSYSLTVKAQDGGQPPLSSYVHVDINVTDVNDNRPIFSQSTYTAEIEENMEIGSSILRVTVSDADEGLNSYLRYYVEGGSGLFKVDSNGVINVNGTLDYESTTTFSFLVFAEESSTTESWKANCTVIITLKDVNEFDPEFTKPSYYGYTEENSPANTNVVTVQATDQDGVFNVLSYNIISGNENGYFAINQTSGAITTTGPIDRETADQFILKIQASDNGSPNRTTETFLVVDIFDANDHAPIFSRSLYNTSVPESLPVGTTVLAVKAVDLDVNSTNSAIRYFVSGSDSKFDVTESGHVFVNGSLDYESKSVYSFMIFAEESSTVAKQQHNATVVIAITDVNEYDPIFTQSSFYGNLSENSASSTSVVQIAASDNDGRYNDITYSIIPSVDSGSFSINGSSGLVTTAVELDRETKSQFILTVQAKDNGTPSRTSEVTVIIDVLDVSDHRPLFLQQSYNATIFENVEVGTTVLTVKAEDKDEALNARFDYYIVGGDDNFDILNDGVIVTKAALDYEARTFYEFLVFANETSFSGNAKANVTVTVFLGDVNEFNPVFTKLRYSANVSENSAIGTPVVQVNASDEDGQYNQLTFNIVSGNDDGKFIINNTTGLITTDVMLDRETKDQFILNVRAQDNGVGSSARTAEVVVVIYVVDLSDHTPTFLQSDYNTTVFENVAVGTTVLTVLATDNDKGENAAIHYYIVGGDGVFHVTENGHIVVNNSLDYEKKVEHQFQVIAEESKTTTSFNDTTNVTIFVNDVNEYNPKFSKLSYSAVVNDSNKEGTPVIHVSATDDDGSHKTISYSIVYGNDGDYFNINSTTGWITTNAALDGDTASQFVLTVKAEDNGDFPRTAEVLVVISINETNRNASFLLQDMYNVTVLENALVGSTVLKLDVQDSDKDINSVFNFNIVGGNGDFAVTSRGEIQVSRALDYETKSTYDFTVVVTEVQPASGLAANATVNVKVVDVNEFNPKFSQNRYDVNVSESAVAGTLVVQVIATDEDGDYNVLSYAIIHGNDGNNFTINSTSGEIRTATVLDRETQDQYILTVRAQDNGPSGRTSEVVVIVDILDISDHPPVFLMSNYSGVVYENSPLGTSVLTVKTTDKDTKSSELTFSVVGADGKFDVTSEGVIYVNGSLDYETDTMYTFVVTAEEPSPYSHLRHNTTVLITVMDVNEFNPKFNQTIYGASINENDAVGTTVLTVFASDEDKDDVLTYSIIAGNDQGNFSINNNTGEITIARQHDRESNHQVILTVRAEDNGIPPRTSEVTVVVGITDSNDNGPVFLASRYNGSVSENAVGGTTVLAVLALDQDSTRNSLDYHIYSEDAFKMETHYGLGFVVVNKKLDYELKKSYSFSVYAVELPDEKRNTSVLVNITILDANDNRPVFGNSSYSSTVMEGMAIGTPIVNVSASDADSEAFGPLYFKIVEGDPLGNFSIGNMTGLISTETVLDRERQQTFVLIVEARDNGSPALTETVTVTITVVDNNDASPLFIGSPYATQVQENTPISTSVLTVQALDMDKSENGEYAYSLFGANGLFSITQDGNIGYITVAGPLDYETNKTFRFYVVAKETKTSEMKETNASVVVTLTDVNDNTPKFSQMIYEFTVSESPTFPITVGTVVATDRDSGALGNVTYFIIHGDENGNFTINYQTGEVETGAILNREVQDRYVLTIEARDAGSPPRTAVATIIVKVSDQNEQPPIFQDTPYEANVVENQAYADSTILKVNAIDPDEMEVTYTLQPSSEFAIERLTGVIKATGTFDREAKALYNLTVTAIDQGGRNVSEQVIIHVTDTNDNTPQFVNTPYQTTIPDNTTIGVTILTVAATDLDEAHNGEILFSLLGAEGKFAINQSSGEITVAGKLDRQVKATYVLQVVATDRGIPQYKVNSTMVVVNLTDYSNGAPKFESVAYVGEINEHLGNTFVLNVKANDPDDGLLGQITYSITGGNTYNAFQINSTGAILSTMSLDFENATQKTFDLTVMAADRDGLSDTTQVRITVADVNDNAPTIVNIPSPAEVNISDGVPADTLLYVLQGQDVDSGSNGDFEFFGTAVPDNLTIDRTTGIIQAKTKLYYSTASQSILFTIHVKDRGTPRKSSSSYNITFNLIPDPTSDPFLLPTLTEATVFENASINDVIAIINASLTADNYTIVFELPNSGHFEINSSGSLSLVQKLDRETLDGYSLLVKATRGGKQALGYVSITVLDVNDESPEFRFNVYKGQIDENLALGSTVLQVTAEDKDDQSIVTYSITSGNSEGVFNISSTGVIQLAKSSDYETTDFFNLTVVASDGVSTGSTVVEITILDVNDNSPVFRNSSYSATVSEDTPGGTSIVTVSAVDADNDDIIVYSISGDDGKFTIDSITGVITTTAQSLDYETQTSYTLNITATDMGGLKASVLVYLNLTNSNDHKPTFMELPYNVTIAENHLGVLPLVLNATDADSGIYGSITYSIVGASSTFSIDPVTGAINSTAPIDRDDSGIASDAFCRGVLILSVQASDGGSPPLTDKTIVTILVTDINDNKPIFSKSSYEAVISVIDIGNVFRMKANDPDCGMNSEIRYSFTSDNDSSLFQINATTGNVTIIKSLNGSQGVYVLNVTASNEFASPKLQSSVVLTITVLENKNYAPRFGKAEYDFHVAENAEIGWKLGDVSAVDVNQGKEGVFIYSIQNPGYTIPFDIDPETGAIILVRALDRETVANYTLAIVAKDFGKPPLSQTARVLITVDDVNDIVPKFPNDVHSISVSEDLVVGSLVGSVTALDEDDGEHGSPIYVLYSGNEGGYFRIDNSTGNIYLVKNLDREYINVFRLTIHAYNHGSNISRSRRDVAPQFSEIVVVINITDVNDNNPIFVQPNYVAGFKDSSDPGANVTTVLAFDKDDGLNSKIVYSIQSGNEDGAFAIDPNTGLITTTAAASQLTQSEITLTVVARDSSVTGTPKETLVPATVTIYKLESNPLDIKLSSDVDRETIIEILKNITGPGSDIIIESISGDGLLSNVKYYVIKNGDFMTQTEVTNLIIKFCEDNEDICKKFGMNLSTQDPSTGALLGEDDITILEAMLITLGVIIAIGGILGILLLCCLRRRKRYMPVYEPSELIIPSKAVSFDEKPHFFQPDPQSLETQEVEIHMDEERSSSSVDSAEEVARLSTSSNDIESTDAIAKVHAYMNQALMNDDTDSDTDSSDDAEPGTSSQVRADGGSSTGSTEPLVETYTITNI